MRYAQGAAIAFALLALSPSPTFGQSGLSNLSIPPSNSSYQLVSSRRFSLTQFYYTYRAVLTNTGSAITGVTATVTSLTPGGVMVVAGQGTVHFDPVPADGQVTSTDTFTILVDRTVAFSFSDLQWSFNNPFADPGPNQTVPLNSTVTLNGSGLTNPGGIGSLTYSWTLQSVPAGSTASLSNANTMVATFVADVNGTYTVQLTVNNGTQSDSEIATVSTVNSPPVANAGPNQTVAAGSTVQLNGSKSFDVDGNPLSYSWTFASIPASSAATLANPTSVTPSFTADVTGTYIVALVVYDGVNYSAQSTVTVTTGNTPPVARTGSNQQVNVNTLVQLNGAGSTDVNGNALTYVWTLNTTQASGSKATLSNSTAVNPTFTADVPGTYVAQLIVNDGFSSSQPATTTISTNAVQAPTANAGPPQNVSVGTTVQLTGAGSTDPQGLPLTYIWQLVTRPASSSASLSSTTIVNPTFLADQPGTYVWQLSVNDGFLSSTTPATVTITTTDTPPVANAGMNQTASVGGVVFLNGSQSYDPDNQPLTYCWAFLSIPMGSSAMLSPGSGPCATTANPSFTADVAGTYVVQLIVSDPFLPSQPSTVTITAGNFTITLTPSPLNLTSAPGTLMLTLNPTPASAVSVGLSGFDPAVISVQTPVTVQANTSGVNVTVTPLASGTTGVVASATGYKSGNATVTVVTPSVSVALTNPATGASATAVGLTHSLNGTLTLSAAAPSPGGTTIMLSSDPLASGQVSFNPASVTIAAGNTIGTFTLMGTALGSTTITASAPGVTSGTTPLLVTNLGGILLNGGVPVSVGVGLSTPLPVTLQFPAPGDGTTVTLASTAPGTVTVSPTTISFAPGSTTPITQPQVTGVAAGSASITASSGGYTGNSVTVNVAGSITLSPSTVSVSVGGTGNINVNLSATAPDGGLVVNLSSSNTAIATVPASVTVTGQSAPVLVTGVAAGMATITASTASPSFTFSGTGVAVTVNSAVVLTCPAVTAGTQGVPFNSGALTVTGGLSPYTFSVVGGLSNLPAGLSLNASTGAVTGTPTAPGTFTIQVKDSNGVVAVTTCPFTINPPLLVTCSTTTTGTQGVAFNSGAITVTGGTKPYTFSIVGGLSNLTAGLSLNASTGAVTGTPTATGTFSIQVSDASGATGTACPITINGTLSVTCSTTTAGTQGVAFNSGAITVTGGTKPYTFSIVGGLSNLTAGLSLNTSTGAVTGTPTASGTFSIQVTNVNGATGTACPITINPPLSVTCSTTTAGTQGAAFNSGAITVTGGTKPYTFSIVGGLSNLTAGLSLNTSTGAVTGTPTAPGTFSIQVTDANGATGTACPITINPPLSVTCSTTTTGTVGGAFNSGAITVTGGTKPYTFSIVGGLANLPTGLSLNTSTGAVTGTPSATGTFSIQVNDASGATGTTCPITINPGLSVTCSTTTTGTQGVAFNSGAITVTGGTKPYTFSIVGGLSNLPAGLSLNTSTGAVTGMPTASGTFSIQVTDANSITGTACPITINPPLSVTCSTTTAGTQGVLFNSGAITVTGGTKPYTFSIVGGVSNLTAGLSLNTTTGAVTGTPTASGAFSVQVTDANGAIGAACPITINPPLSVTCSTTTSGTVGVAFNSGAVTVTGGTKPYTFSIVGGLSNLPTGLSLNTSTGAVTGTPGAAGAFSIQVSDASGAVGTPCPITITAGLSVTCSTTTTGTQGFAFNSGPIGVVGGTAPYLFSIVGGIGNLPAGLSLNASTGAVSGAPTVTGSLTNQVFAVQVTDAHGLSGMSCSITIQPPLTITFNFSPAGIAGDGLQLPAADCGRHDAVRMVFQRLAQRAQRQQRDWIDQRYAEKSRHVHDHNQRLRLDATHRTTIYYAASLSRHCPVAAHRQQQPLAAGQRRHQCGVSRSNRYYRRSAALYCFGKYYRSDLPRVAQLRHQHQRCRLRRFQSDQHLRDADRG